MVAVQQRMSDPPTGVVVGNVATGTEFVVKGLPAFDGVHDVRSVDISGDGSIVLFTVANVTYVLRMP